MSDSRQQLAHVAVLVRDYDEAIAWYTGVLGFRLLQDSDRGAGKRRVLVAPPGHGAAALLLARAATARQQARIGDQTGGRVFLFLHTDDFWRDYRAMQEAGVRFAEAPREEPYATVVVRGPVWQPLGPAAAARGRCHGRRCRLSLLVCNSGFQWRLAPR